ncbi:ShlB/FhaC/HecB family hemolysin secretion/activation protein [Aquabacterium sp.]|uniref:ShlB/FhaC/HecB family hemolysin secretion/activation protein n=1 Tax=Aquabacterium sp. TaxID=1872578 RepID=UPI0035B37F64
MKIFNATCTQVARGTLCVVSSFALSAIFLSPTVAAPVEAPAAERAAGAPAFDILEFQVEGNTVLPVLAIERALTPFTGPGKTLADVEAARAALEKVYQDGGYLSVFVDIPEQRVGRPGDADGGVVRLKVSEGRVERLWVSGSRYFSQGYIREQVTELTPGTVPNFNVVQQQLGAVNRTEDRRVQPVLRPGKEPGTVEAELRVADRVPLSLNVELSNNYAPDTKPLRLTSTLRYDNLFQRDHSLALTVVTSPADPGQTTVSVLNYTIPGADGSAWALYGLHSNSKVEPLGTTTAIGRGNVVGLRYVMPLPARKELSQLLTLGIDYKNFNQAVGNTPADTANSHLLYAPLSLGYTLNTQGDGLQSQFNVVATAGSRTVRASQVDCLGYDTKQDAFNCARSGADEGFFTLRGDWRATQRLWGHWDAVVHLGAQLANEPLVSNEQYSLGGADSVRGYLVGEVSGDHAVLGSLAVRSPNWVAPDEKGERPLSWLNELNSYVFMDAARAFVIDPLAGQDHSTGLSSVGLGLQFRAPGAGGLSGGIDVAWPFNDTAYTTRHHPRAQARVSAQF